MRPQNLFLCLLLVIAATGCHEASQSPAETASTSGHTNVFSGHGFVRDLTPTHRAVTIQHDAVAGYMGAMTMDFFVKDTNDLNGISPGDEINFQLVVRQDDDWVQDIRLISHHISDVTNHVVVFHAPSDELKVGDALPDETLTAEDGRAIRLSDFHGRALAFTFFFTSCPLPDFCPRMNKNFAEARQLLTADTNAPANWQFLSISFDPVVDRPEVLGSYAGLYRAGDTNRWLFAVGETNALANLAPQLDLHFWREGGSISHNLRTVVLDTNGRITHQFDGNDWTAQDLANAIREAAKIPAQ